MPIRLIPGQVPPTKHGGASPFNLPFLFRFCFAASNPLNPPFFHLHPKPSRPPYIALNFYALLPVAHESFSIRSVELKGPDDAHEAEEKRESK